MTAIDEAGVQSDAADEQRATAPLSMAEILATKQPAWAEVEVTLVGGRVAVFRFEAIGHLALEALLAAYPASEEAQDAHRAEQEAQGKPPAEHTVLRWDHDAFGPALLAATCVAPRMSIDEATALWRSERFTQRELDKLWGACLLVNEAGSGVRPLAASPGIPGFGPSSK